MILAIEERPELSSTQQEILAAAIRCVKRFGIERVTLNDIAKEAGVARSTVYSHYLNRDDVVRFALLHSAYSFAEKVIASLVEVPAGAERIIEAMVYTLQSLPDEPCLALITDEKLSSMVNAHTLTTEAGFDINTAVYRYLLGDTLLSAAVIGEQAEFTIRTMFSLLTMPGPEPRDEQALRGFVARWLLPALGLEIPSRYLCAASARDTEYESV